MSILEFQSPQEKALTMAILETIVDDVDAYSHPALSEPELEVRRQVLHNVVRLTSVTNWRGQYGAWRTKARFANYIGAGVSSVFFSALAASAWLTTGHWWDVAGNLFYGVLAPMWFLLNNRMIDSQEWLDSLKLPLAKVELPSSKDAH
jgi:hypothetical protein